MIKNSRQRLFEMMNRVSGMPLIKENQGISNLPPGILSSDFMSLEDYIQKVPCNTSVAENNSHKELNNPLDFGAKLTKVDDIQKLLKRKEAEIGAKKQDYETGGRIHNKTIEAIKTTEGNFDAEKLKKILKHIPTQNQFLSQNTKMRKTNFYNISLPAFNGLIYSQTDDNFYVVTVCDKADECLRDCYAQMGFYIIHDATVRLNSQKLNYLLNHWREWERRMVLAIKSISWDGGTVIRWHDSGDFISEKYLQIAFDVAKQTPNDDHYAYTKEVGMVLKSEIPNNFEFKFSYGGKEDNLINPNIHGHARVIPEKLFSDLQPKDTGEGWNFSPESIEILKDRIANEYHFNRDILKTNNEIMKIPYNKNEKHERKWIVINWSGNNDIPALRRDVLAVYNLKHR